MKQSDPPDTARILLLAGSMLCAAMTMPAAAQIAGHVAPYSLAAPVQATGPGVYGQGQAPGVAWPRPMPPDIDGRHAQNPNIRGPAPGNFSSWPPPRGAQPQTSGASANIRVPLSGPAAFSPPTPSTGYLAPGATTGSSPPPGGSIPAEALACASCPADEGWTFQILPDGLMYRAYLAGTKESRIASVWNYEQDLGWLWDITLGGRVGLLRYGTADPFWPEGWQLDIEGAGQPRLDLEIDSELISADFRFGIPLTYRRGMWETKFAYYHLSSHLGDEFMIRNPTVTRINYSRDVSVLAVAVRPLPVLRLYAEAGWAFASDVGLPWEFQFGAELSMREPTGLRGAPFMAVNGHIREEVNYSGNLVVQMGWQWRGYDSGHLMRLGAEYYTGKSRQFEFFDESEQQLGMGLWYDY